MTMIRRNLRFEVHGTETYLHFTDHPRTEHIVNDTATAVIGDGMVAIDYDHTGHILGIEFVGNVLPADLFKHF